MTEHVLTDTDCRQMDTIRLCERYPASRIEPGTWWIRRRGKTIRWHAPYMVVYYDSSKGETPARDYRFIRHIDLANCPWWDDDLDQEERKRVIQDPMATFRVVGIG